MSATPVGREVAHRLFAAEFDAASMSYSESDEERAPNYVVTPTGARVNRMFAVGVLTEIDTVNEDQLRARIVDPTGAFVVYAGQYQPEALTFLENASVPTFVAVTGKARTFEPADSDRVYTSIRPESISEVDAETRERWTVTTAERTLERIATFAGALALDARGDDLHAQLAAQGVSESLAAGIPKAIDHYGTTPAYLAAMETLATQALSVVTGDRDSVPSFTAEPSMAGPETPTRVTSFEAVETVTDAADEGLESVEAEVEAELDSDDADSEESVDAAESAEEPKSDPTVEAETEPEVETDEPVIEDSPPEDAEQVVESEPAIETEAPEEDATGTVPEAEPVDAAEQTATQQAEPADDVDDELGDFEEDDDLEDFEPGEFDEMYEMDDEERKEVEAEFGTEFSTGSEVGPAGEAGIEVPEPEAVEAAAEPDAADPEPEPEPADADGDDDADVDVEDAVLEAMRDLDDGDGADREAIIAAVVEAHGVSVEAVEDAIQDALMDGQCYEPNESTLTAI